jgi:tetratricopeptide (TPR) repeat protein
MSCETSIIISNVWLVGACQMLVLGVLAIIPYNVLCYSDKVQRVLQSDSSLDPAGQGHRFFATVENLLPERFRSTPLWDEFGLHVKFCFRANGSFFIAYRFKSARLAIAVTCWFLISVTVMSLRKELPILVIVFMTAGILYWYGMTSSVDLDEKLRSAQTALRRQEFDKAESLAKEIMASKHSDAAALIAGESAVRQGRFTDAIDHYAKAVDWADNDVDASQNLVYLAEAAVQIGQLSNAENAYRRALALNSDSTLAATRLEFLLRVEGRLIESRQFLHRRIQSNSAGFEEALNYGHPSRMRELPDALRNYMTELRRDRLPLIGVARENIAGKRTQAGIDDLNIVLDKFPDCIDAQTVLGTVLLDQDEARFVTWYESLPDTCRDEPSVWMLRGRFAERHSQWAQAARGYYEVLQVEPSLRDATRHMAIVLEQLRHPDIAAAFRERAAACSAIETLLDELHDTNQPQAALTHLIPLLVSGGRLEEAVNWNRLGKERLGPQYGHLIDTDIESVQNQHRVVGGLLDSINVGDFPIPVPRLFSKPGETDAPAVPIRFTRRAEDEGFDFRFVNAPSGSGERRMVQSNGGGTGIIDFDRDSWPDMFMTQGGDWPADAGQSGRQPGDQLFRNLRGRTVVDVTSSAGAADAEFSQGVAIGDFDSDGFPDVFVANIGSNRLLMNNGDGTFSDVTLAAEIHGNEWSTSCVFADVNADGYDDLYIVNYLSLSDAASGICADEGKLKRCSSGEFIAAADQLLVNVGDGTFRDISKSSGIIHDDGRGLGVAAADFNLDGSIDVFVANDAVPNFLLLNQTTAGQPRFAEAAVASGIAVAVSGEPQACMGIAVADFDHNRMPDVFVTNFLNESNTMYFGLGTGLFVDRTRSLHLTQPSISMLGFGTQPIDLDMDGFDDLVVLNGHIDDLSAAGVAYQMPIQFFWNKKGAGFVPVESRSAFLTEKHVGRSLAVADWNRDGRQDLVAGLLDESSCLLENDTPTSSGWLQIRLVGDSVSRRANGTRVTVASSNSQGEGTWVMKIAGGGGFQASNDSTLTFGLGEHTGDCTITVHWPNCPAQTLTDVLSGHSLTIIQRVDEAQAWTVPE